MEGLIGDLQAAVVAALARPVAAEPRRHGELLSGTTGLRGAVRCAIFEYMCKTGFLDTPAQVGKTLLQNAALGVVAPADAMLDGEGMNEWTHRRPSTSRELLAAVRTFDLFGFFILFLK